MSHIQMNLSLKRGQMGYCLKGSTDQPFPGCIPVSWFQLFRAVPNNISAGVGWGSHPAHIICYSQLLQHPHCMSLLASAFALLSGLATTSPLCQTCRLVGLVKLTFLMTSVPGLGLQQALWSLLSSRRAEWLPPALAFVYT